MTDPQKEIPEIMPMKQQTNSPGAYADKAGKKNIIAIILILGVVLLAGVILIWYYLSSRPNVNNLNSDNPNSEEDNVDGNGESVAEIEWTEDQFDYHIISEALGDLTENVSFSIPKNWTLAEVNPRVGEGIGDTDCYDYTLFNADKTLSILIAPYCGSFGGFDSVTKSYAELTLIASRISVGNDGHDSYIVRFDENEKAMIGEVNTGHDEMPADLTAVIVESGVTIFAENPELNTQYDSPFVPVKITIEDNSSGDNIQTIDRIVSSLKISSITSKEIANETSGGAYKVTVVEKRAITDANPLPYNSFDLTEYFINLFEVASPDSTHQPITHIAFRIGETTPWSSAIGTERYYIVSDADINESGNYDDDYATVSVESLDAALIPYIKSSKYCEKDLDCQIRYDFCTKDAYNEYHGYVSVWGCEGSYDEQSQCIIDDITFTGADCQENVCTGLGREVLCSDEEPL